MGQTLNHGVYLPAEGERNCYSGLASNWNLLDAALGDIDGKASATHTHGNITNDGKVGTTANKPLITGTGGVVQAGSFGNAANTFCEGNDSRLSDARTPVAHTHTKSDVTDLFNSVNTWIQDQTYSTGSYGQMIWLKNTDLDLSLNGNTGLSSIYQHMIHWVDKNNAVYSSIQSWTTSSENTLVLRSKYRTDANTVRGLSVRFTSTATNKGVYPETSADTELGTSTNQWKSFNGINPGALSLPDMDSTVSKSTELATAIDKTQTDNSWTADFTGILRITWFVKNLTGPFRCSVFNNSDIRYATWGQTFSANDVWYFIVSFPVQNGKTYYINNSFTRTSEDTSPIVYGASAVYCLGNV